MSRTLRTPTRLPRTPDAVRQEAAEHHRFLAESPGGIGGLSAVDCKRAAEYGRALVDLALDTPENTPLDFTDWAAVHAPRDEDKALIIGSVMPYLSGQLALLKMEFVHEGAGVLPPSLLRELLSGGDHISHNGYTFSSADVIVRYRRLGL